MKLFISADMEGVAGVVASYHTSPEHKDYERFRRLMTAEVNAAIEGALVGGAEQIVVNDSHGPSTNILIEDLNPAARLVTGSPQPLGMMHGIGPDTDVAFLLGYHASSGTDSGVLGHTWSGIVFSLHLNDQEVGETGLNAALAGSFGVPVVLVTGDMAVVSEARSLLGAIHTVVVKEGVSHVAADCLHPQVARERIHEEAARSVGLIAPPFEVAPPITVRITFQLAGHADLADVVPLSRRVDGRTLEWTGDDMLSVYRAFMAMVRLAGLAGR
jgi:D-amino peptidase